MPPACRKEGPARASRSAQNSLTLVSRLFYALCGAAATQDPRGSFPQECISSYSPRQAVMLPQSFGHGPSSECYKITMLPQPLQDVRGACQCRQKDPALVFLPDTPDRPLCCYTWHLQLLARRLKQHASVSHVGASYGCKTSSLFCGWTSDLSDNKRSAAEVVIERN